MNNTKNFDRVILTLYQVDNTVGMMKYFPNIFSLIFRNRSAFVGMSINTFSPFNNFVNCLVSIENRIICNVSEDPVKLFSSLLCPDDSRSEERRVGKECRS